MRLLGDSDGYSIGTAVPSGSGEGPGVGESLISWKRVGLVDGRPLGSDDGCTVLGVTDGEEEGDMLPFGHL